MVINYMHYVRRQPIRSVDHVLVANEQCVNVERADLPKDAHEIKGP